MFQTDRIIVIFYLIVRAFATAGKSFKNERELKFALISALNKNSINIFSNSISIKISSKISFLFKIPKNIQKFFSYRVTT